MAPYSPPLEGRGEKLRLDFNENVAGCSPHVLDTLRECASQDFVATYPEYEEARRRIGGHLGVGAGQIALGAGTDEVISGLMHAFVGHGGEVLVLKPSFSMFRFYAEQVGATARAVHYTMPDLQFPLQDLIDAVEPQTRAICIASPNNPTGGVIRTDQLERVLEAVDGCAVLVDEAYFHFHGRTAIGMLDDWPNLFVGRTFSKAYGMAGLRVGVLVSQEANIAMVRKGQSPYGVNSLAIRCAMAAIEDTEYVADYVEQVRSSRQFLCEALRAMNVRYWDSEANFVLFEIGERSREVVAQVSSQGILIRDQSSQMPGTARVTVGPLNATVRFLAILKEVLG